MNSREIITHNIHLKSQNTVVRAIYGLASGVFRFALAVIVFQILVDFWQNNSFWKKMVASNENTASYFLMSKEMSYSDSTSKVAYFYTMPFSKLLL